MSIIKGLCGLQPNRLFVVFDIFSLNGFIAITTLKPLYFYQIHL